MRRVIKLHTLLVVGTILVQMGLAFSPRAQTTSEIGFKLPSEIELDAREEYYDVFGNTAAAIYASMRENVPVDLSPFFAKHQWGLAWEFHYAMNRGSCAIQDVTLRLTSTTTLPRWEPEPYPPANLLHDWDRFMRALREHERGHQEFAVEAARAVRKALRGIRTTECGSISPAANSVAEKILEGYTEKDKIYDADTHHGRTQGAIWPPRD